MRKDLYELAPPPDGAPESPSGLSDALSEFAAQPFEDLVSVARLLARSRGAALRFWSAGRSWTGAAIDVTEAELAHLDNAARVEARARPAMAFPVRNARESLFALAAPLELPHRFAGALLLIDDEPRRYELDITAALERLAAALAPRVAARADGRAATLLQSAPDAFISVRSDFGVDYRNPSADRLFGPKLGQLPAYLDTIFPEDVRENSRNRLLECVARLSPGEVETLQFVGLRADGRVFPMELTVSTVRDSTGDRLSIIIRDCAQRFAAESALKAAKSAAEAASRAKTSFLANISHELQTPLNGVIGLLDGLVAAPLEAGPAESVRLALTSARDLQALVADVLELTRLESESEPIRPASFEIRDFGASLVETFTEAAQRKGLDLRLEIEPDAELNVRGDAEKIGRMLSRLLANAIKFTAQGHVGLKISRSGASLFRFEVIDSGVGFAPDLAPRLFDPFEQAELGLTRRFGGAGLGLALCREIANLLGAEIGCASAPGRGSTFHVTLPLEVEAGRGEIADRQVSARSDPLDPGRPLRVLVADDNDVNRKVLETILATIQAEVAVAEDGSEALETFRRAPFDLILMDMMMPVMDGLSATQAIRRIEIDERRPRTPIIMVSANTLPEHIDAALLAGVDCYLTKPVGARQLLETVGELLAEEPEADELAQAC